MAKRVKRDDTTMGLGPITGTAREREAGETETKEEDSKKREQYDEYQQYSSNIIINEVITNLNRPIIAFLNINDIRCCCQSSKNCFNMNTYKQNAYNYIQEQMNNNTNPMDGIQQILEQISNESIVLPSHLLYVFIFCRAIKILIDSIQNPTKTKKKAKKKLLENFKTLITHCNISSNDEVVFLTKAVLNKKMTDDDSDNISEIMEFIMSHDKIVLSQNEIESLAELAMNQMINYSDISDIYIYKVVKCVANKISQDRFKSLTEVALNNTTDGDEINEMIKFIVEHDTILLSQDDLESLVELAFNRIELIGISKHPYYYEKCIYEMMKCVADVISQEKLKSLIGYILQKMSKQHWIYATFEFIVEHYTILFSQDELEYLSKVALEKMAHSSDISDMIGILKNKIPRNQFISLTEVALNKMVSGENICRVIKCIVDMIPQAELECLAQRELMKMINDVEKRGVDGLRPKLRYNHPLFHLCTHEHEGIVSLIKLLKNKISDNKFLSFIELVLNTMTDGFNISNVMECMVDMISQEDFENLFEREIKKIKNDFSYMFKKDILYDIRRLSKLSNEKFEYLCVLALDKNTDENDIYRMIIGMVDTISPHELKSLALRALIKMTNDKYISRTIECLKYKISQNDLMFLIDLVLSKMSDSKQIYQVMKCIAHSQLHTHTRTLQDELKLKSIANRALYKMSDQDIRYMIELLKSINLSQDQFNFLFTLALNKMTDLVQIGRMIENVVVGISQDEFTSQNELEFLAKQSTLTELTDDESIRRMIEFMKSKKTSSQDDFKLLIELVFIGRR